MLNYYVTNLVTLYVKYDLPNSCPSTIFLFRNIWKTGNRKLASASGEFITNMVRRVNLLLIWLKYKIGAFIMETHFWNCFAEIDPKMSFLSNNGTLVEIVNVYTFFVVFWLVFRYNCINININNDDFSAVFSFGKGKKQPEDWQAILKSIPFWPTMCKCLLLIDFL